LVFFCLFSVDKNSPLKTLCKSHFLKMATPVAALAFNSLRGKSFFLSYYDPTHLICIDSDARYPTFPDSGCGGWTALTVLTRLFSEVDATTTISDFLLSRIIHLLEPAASKRLLMEKPHLSTLWYSAGQSQIEIQTFGCDDWPIFPLPIHYAATAGNSELIIQLVGTVSEKEKYVQLVGTVSEKEKYVSAGLGFGCDDEFGYKGYMSGYTCLHLAVVYNRLEVVAYLVRQFPRLVTIRNRKDEYPVEMIAKNSTTLYPERQSTKHKIVWWLLRTDFTGWMLGKKTDHVKPWRPTPGWEHMHTERRPRHQRISYMNIGQLIEETFPVTLEMPFPDYLTPMSKRMNGKIIRLEKKQATEEKKEINLADMMKERPHSAMCNDMFLVLIGLLNANCGGKSAGDPVILIMQFAFWDVMDMITPSSMSKENLHLGLTQDELDEDEDWDAEQEDDAEQEECAADDSSEDTFHRGLTQQENDAEQEECAAEDSGEDSAWWL